MYKVVVSSRGQVVIPIEARKKLDIREGDELQVHIEAGDRIVFKAGRKGSIKKGIVSKTAGLLADMEMSGVEYVENIRKDSGRRVDDHEGGN